jgi:hypothetical protein
LIYYSYAMRVQIFKRLRPAVLKLQSLWGEND